MRVFWITATVILVDQITKVLVYLNMYRNQSIPLVGDWLKLTFTENPGMAFGIDFGPRGMVTMFSVAATVLIIAYMWRVRGGYRPYLVSLALILGGALGNIIDRVFYGVIFGYAPLFMGRVVDFVHVDLWRGTLRELLPFLGGGGDVYFALFPIWNVADMAIVGGVVGILVFQQRFHLAAAAAASGSAEQPHAEDAPSGADSATLPTAAPASNGQPAVARGTSAD
jgi:signal peptidase II